VRNKEQNICKSALTHLTFKSTKLEVKVPQKMKAFSGKASGKSNYDFKKLKA
jgi:hypothetical protein